MAFRILVLLALVGCIQCNVINLTCNEIKEFVNIHNIKRQDILHGKVPGQPAASTMNYMVWDEELARKARGWASVLRYEHNPDRSVGSRRFTTGENLYWFSTTASNPRVNIRAALDAWWNEHQHYRYGQLSARDFAGPEQVGHYTQMVWSNSVYVGCAVSQFSSGGWNTIMVACNYGPAGNVMGQTPYRSGNPGRQLLCSIGNCDRPYGTCS